MQKTDIMTADELFEMKEDEYRYELIRGRLVRMSPAGFEHSAIGTWLIGRLVIHLESNPLGQVFGADFGVVFSRDPDTVRVPDVSFIRQERLAGQRDRKRFSEVIPDLTAEVISPSDSLSQVMEKALFYIEAGVRLVWIIDPDDRTVIVYSQDVLPHVLHEQDELDGGDILPDFRLRVGELFS